MNLMVAYLLMKWAMTLIFPFLMRNILLLLSWNLNHALTSITPVDESEKVNAFLTK